ncbi:Uncharacterised protein [Bordetella pertussis]|nr:Uncharacterised protein [Bordetella pertussis]
MTQNGADASGCLPSLPRRRPPQAANLSQAWPLA